jgi:hypothetical protein
MRPAFLKMALTPLLFFTSVSIADIKEFTFDEGLSDTNNSVVLWSYLYLDSPSDPVIQDGVVRLDTGAYLASPGTILSSLDFNRPVDTNIRFKYEDPITLDPNMRFHREILTTSTSDQRDEGFNLAIVQNHNNDWHLQFQLGDGAGLLGLPNGEGFLIDLGVVDPYSWQEVAIIFDLGAVVPRVGFTVNGVASDFYLTDVSRGNVTDIISLLSGGEYRVRDGSVRFFMGDSPIYKESHSHSSTLLIDSFIIGYTPDSDGDGIYDSVDLDDDNDGVNDEQELLDGTDPFSSFSCLVLCEVLDVDGDGNTDALTDGLLVLRAMFGLTGEALTDGAVSAGAYYTSSDDILVQVSALGDRLDIDQNGSVDALTDGLLILRSLFGLTGDVLTSGVLAINSPITDASEIELGVAQLSNRAPVITSMPNFRVAENTSLIGDFSAFDTDSPDLTFTVSGSEMMIDSEATLTFVSAPDYEAQSLYVATVTVSDGINEVTQDISVVISNLSEYGPEFEYYGTMSPSWAEEPPEDYQLFSGDTQMGGQLEGFDHESTEENGGGKFQFHRVHRTFKHGLEWGQQFGVFGTWLKSMDSNNTVEGGHWVNPKVDGPEYYPTLHFGGGVISYNICGDATMGGGPYERVLGDRWLAMVQISNRVLYGSGLNIAFDHEQDPHETDNGIWAGSGWSYLNFDHPRDFKFWMSFVETGNYQGPIVGYVPEYWNWLDPDLYDIDAVIAGDIDEPFATLADNGTSSNSLMANERINLSALNLGDSVFYAPVPKLPNHKEKEYLIAHPQGISLDTMENYSAALRENRLDNTLILGTEKAFRGFYESTHQELKVIEEIDGVKHTTIIEPQYELGYDEKGGYVQWDHSTDALKQSQDEQNGYLYLRKTDESWNAPDECDLNPWDSYACDPNIWRSEIIDAPDDIVRVPSVNHRYFNVQERDTTHPDFVNWDITGKKRYTRRMQNGATATYVWFKFIKQPAMLTAAQNHPETYTPEYLAQLQSYIEALHLAINENSTDNPTAPVFINYRGADNPDNKDPHLANISDDRLVSPEEGFEVGYVPIMISLYHADDVGAIVSGDVNDSAKGLWSEPTQECSNDKFNNSYLHDFNN